MPSQHDARAGHETGRRAPGRALPARRLTTVLTALACLLTTPLAAGARADEGPSSAGSTAATTKADVATADVPATSSATSPSAAARPSVVLTSIPSASCTDAVCTTAQKAAAGGKYAEAAQAYASHARALLTQPEAQRQSYGDWVLRAAYMHEQARNHDEAARLYQEAIAHMPALRDFLHVAAGRNLVHSTRADANAPLRAILDSGALARGYAGADLVHARIEARLDDDGLPTAATMTTALRGAHGDEACTWLVETLESRKAGQGKKPEFAALANLAHGHCTDAALTKRLAALKARLTDEARLRRAGGLFAKVRFSEALEELEAIKFDRLSPEDRCTAHFTHAQTLFRLRKNTAADREYLTVIDRCKTAASEDVHVRSLYAMGRRYYDRKKYDDSRRLFETLLSAYPTRSHADDALFYLARIERAAGTPERERELLGRALASYPDGDMTHEMVWEVHEALIRGGKYRQFIDAIAALELPAYDNQYYSQGRLEYFVALAHDRLGEKPRAFEHWQRAWTKYPFSFYGYLSHLRLEQNGQTPSPIRADASARRTRWFEGAWLTSGSYQLARLGLYDGACDFETRRQRDFEPSDDDRWRLAALCHAAGRYPLSHNIARRQIAGRPWAMPDEGRLARWEVAWPDPFGPNLARAITAEAEQWPGRRVHRGLASSIMREESSFIPDVVSWAGAIGLMQLMPKTALDHDGDIDGRATPERLKEPDVNIRVAVDHLFMLANRFDSHPVLMAAAYNAGGGRVNGWLRNRHNDDIALWVEDIPPLQTRDYTKRVIGSYAAYQWLQGEPKLDPTVGLDPPKRK